MNLYDRSGNLSGQTFELDASLSDQTKAANAKSAGDAVDDCYEKLDPEVWEQREPFGFLKDYGDVSIGSINNSGEFVPGSSGAVSDYIPVSEGEIYVFRNTNGVYTYDSGKEFVANAGNIGTWVCLSTVSYIRVTSTTANKDTARVINAEMFGDPNINGYIYTGVTTNTDTLIRKGIHSFAGREPLFFTESENQFDYENDWVHFAPGGYGLAYQNGSFSIYTNYDNEFRSGCAACPIKYFEVEEGQLLVSNKSWQYGAYYNEDKEYIDSFATGNSFLAPEGCKYARFSFNGITNVEELKELTIYLKNFSAVNARGEKIYYPVPKYQINGAMISSNYLDKVVPSMRDSVFLSSMKCLAIREANAREHSFRIANFNTCIGNGSRGWDLIKKMLMDFGVDFCGFEEAYHTDADLAAFLKSWQFPYGFYTNKTDEDEVIGQSFVSRYPITATKLYYTYNDNKTYYLNCKVTLPRLLDVYNPIRTLSCYIVHLHASGREGIAAQILATIAEDTSDYIVILGDFNDEGTTEENKKYARAFEAEGFRPVLPITSKTITRDDLASADAWKNMAIDQFCVSSNIEVARYGILNTKEGYGDATVQTINGTPCLSDHDFVWADIIFKDEVRTVPNN